MKLLTPIARTLPSASSVSRARYASRVRSKALGSAWWRISRSDLLDAELSGALLEPVQRLVVAVVGDPDLGLEEDVRSVEAPSANRVADLALVAVGGGGVDVAVPRVERCTDGVAGLVGRRLEDAEAESGQLDPVAEGHGRDGGGHGWHFFRWAVTPWRFRTGLEGPCQRGTDRAPQRPRAGTGAVSGCRGC
jgi:hypothetical protein